jgi:hypothetical protein
MPLTEYLWHFDNGGDDFELGVFSVAIVVCLILVMLQNRNRGFSLILAVRARIFFARQDKDNSTRSLPCDRVSQLHDLAATNSALSQHSSPILV